MHGGVSIRDEHKIEFLTDNAPEADKLVANVVEYMAVIHRPVSLAKISSACPAAVARAMLVPMDAAERDAHLRDSSKKDKVKSY